MLLYGMAINAIIDSMGINTRCDPPKQHAMHTKINEHAINKLGFVPINNTWVHKETIHELEIVGDEENDDTYAKPSASLSMNLSATLSYPPMSTTFDSEQAFTPLLSYMESMDARMVSRFDVLKAQNYDLLHQ